MDRYKILEELSHTENSDIFLVMDMEKRRACVMKRMKKGGASVYADIAGLGHPNIARIYDVPDDNTVIMEYISGIPLSRLGRRAEEYEVREWIIKLCGAVKILHGAGIIHRDIKPSNIMLTDDGMIKLIDFDAMRIYKSFRSADTHAMGTDGYAPPEQYGFAQTDERSDIFAIGVVMYELLSGGRSVSEIKSYRGLLQPVIEKCTKLAPEERYQNVDELLSALGAGEHTVIRETVKKPKRRAAIITAAAVLVIAVVCAVYILVRNAGYNVLDPARLFSGGGITNPHDIEIDYGVYDEKSDPIGISSVRLEDAYINKGHALHLYARISENDKSYDGHTAVMEFELFDQKDASLGVQSLEYKIGSDEDELADMYIQAYRETGGYKYKGSYVTKIRISDVRIN